MKTIGPLYAGVLNYPHKDFLPIIETGVTQETEMPYRKGKCLVFRLSYTTKGFYFGLLKKTIKNPHLLTDEDIDLLMINAMKGRKAWEPKDGAYNEFF